MSDLKLILNLIEKFDLLYSKVGAGAAEPLEPHQNFCPEPDQHKNDATPQHWYKVWSKPPLELEKKTHNRLQITEPNLSWGRGQSRTKILPSAGDI
jgi:hypothetical protein